MSMTKNDFKIGDEVEITDYGPGYATRSRNDLVRGRIIEINYYIVVQDNRSTNRCWPCHADEIRLLSTSPTLRSTWPKP
jgi:hypothetical protein